jgi:hypothetical protein
MGAFGGFGGGGGMFGNPVSNYGNGDAIGIRPWVTATGSYFSGDVKSLALPNTPDAKSHTFTAGVGAGIGGGKSWGRTNLGITYGINGRIDTEDLRIPAWSHVLSLGVSHVISERTSVFLNIIGGQTNGGFGYGAAPIGGGWGMPYSYGYAMGSQSSGSDFGNPNDNGIVDNEVIASRTQFVGSTAGINHRVSARWSIGGSAGVMYASRGSGLIDNRGMTASAMARYMISPKSSLGIGYGFGRFSYVGLFGGNHVNQVMLSYNRILTPSMTFGIGAGAFRMSSEFVGAVPVDPLLAGLLGLPSASFELQRVNRYSMTAYAGLSKTFGKQGALNFTYNRGASPGNGVFLGSTRDTGTASYSFPTANRISSAAFASYTRLSAIQAFQKSSDNYATGLSLSTRLVKGLNIFVTGGYRITEISDSYRSSGAFATIGISYFPGSVPVFF